jgi:hypothetical protein
MSKSLEDMTVDELRAHAAATESQASLLKSIAANPSTRESLQRLIKTVSPNTVIPEIDAKDSVMKVVDKQNETIQSLERRLMERDARDNVRERRQAIRDKYHLTDDDVTKIEQMMVDDKEVNWTHDAAARVYLASTRTADPTPASFVPPTYEMPEKEVWAGGLGNPGRLNKIAMSEANKAWGEIASGKIAGLGSARAN